MSEKPTRENEDAAGHPEPEHLKKLRLAFRDGSLEQRGVVIREGIIAVTKAFEGSLDFAEFDIVIEASASVRGEITGRAVTILGSVQGHTRALDTIDIRKGAKQIGDITTARIIIEDGAYFKGSIDITKRSGGTQIRSP